MDVALWFEEQASPAHRLQWEIQQQLFYGQSAYQTVQVLKTTQFGNSLVLDGIMQTTTGDEFIYHEMLAYVPLMSHPHPREVLIIGGGDGGLARDVLKDPTVTHVTLVEIDSMVLDVARRFLPEHSQSFDDPRLTIIQEDGNAFLDQVQPQSFDVILVDSTDPEGDGPGVVLYTPAFRKKIWRALSSDGIYVQQTGTPFYNPEVVSTVSHGVAQEFRLCRVFWCTVPTYPGVFFTFTAGSKQYDLLRPIREVAWPSRWYTKKIHQLAFALPPYIADFVPESVRSQQI